MPEFDRRQVLARGGRLGLGLAGTLFAAPPIIWPSRAAAALDNVQTQLVRDINRRFNETDRLEGDFVQIGPNGERAEGKFFLWKPGRMRFEYSPPSPLLIVANGRWVGISDMQERTTERYPLRSTPLKLLLSDEIDLFDDSTIRDVRADADLVTLVLEESRGDAVGSLTMMFDTATLELRQWIVTDAQGLDTSVSLYNTVYGQKREKIMFVIPDYDRIRD